MGRQFYVPLGPLQTRQHISCFPALHMKRQPGQIWGTVDRNCRQLHLHVLHLIHFCQAEAEQTLSVTTLNENGRPAGILRFRLCWIVCC